MKYTAAAALFALVPLPPFASPQDRALLDDRVTVGLDPNVAIPSRFDKPLVEPCVAAHPTDPDHLLVAAMVVTDPERPYRSCRLSSFVSSDGGASWDETAHDWWGYDPWVSILDDGGAVMSWLGNPGKFQDRYPVRFFSSENGGATWSAAVQTIAGNHDGTKLASIGDTSWFTTVAFRADMGADVALLRRSGGEDFEEVARIDSGGKRLNFCEPAVLTSGRVIVPASNYLADVWVQVFDPKTGELSAPYEVSRNPGGGRGYMRLAADTSSASPYRDRAYFVRAAGRGAGRGVWLNVSSDGGKTWSDDARLDLFEGDPESAANVASVASVAVNRDGVVGVSWVDRQHDAHADDVYFAASFDGGDSFQRPQRATQVSSSPTTQANADVANKFAGGGALPGSRRASGRWLPARVERQSRRRLPATDLRRESP